MNQYISILKRSMDILFSIIGLLLSLPLWPLIVLAIKLESSGPVLFFQERVGLCGRRIRMIKFRTMFIDAEKETGPVWATENDRRVTMVGAFLRRTRLDEIPQLVNVLKGDMSMVGPRPERSFFVDKFATQIPFYEERIMDVKPGITGLAQIYSGYDTSIDSVKEKLIYDHGYGASLTRLGSFLRTDLSILLATIIVVFTGKGAK